MIKFQNKIREFDKPNGYNKDLNFKNLCLNVNGDIGEFCNFIKWINNKKEIIQKIKI
jgi:hypothetical protein